MYRGPAVRRLLSPRKIAAVDPTAGTFTDKHQLATNLAVTLMAIEGVPDIPMFRQNTAAFVHEPRAGDLSNVDGASSYVRVLLTEAVPGGWGWVVTRTRMTN